MASPRTRSQEPRDRERNARLADWIAREKIAYLNVVARRKGAPEWQIDDVVQSGLANFFRAFPGPDVREKALAYCARCVASEASKARRRQARKESHDTPIPELVRGDFVGTEDAVALADDGAVDPAARAVERERIAELRARLSGLPEDQRALLALVAAGYGHAEIARMSGLSERQIRKRIHKANRSLGEGG